jgi:hypothetical protein
MNTSFSQRVSIISALTLVLTIGAANAAGTSPGYSWTEILVPSIGPLGLVIGINDYDQIAVNNADNSKTGIYRHGVFTALPAPPAGYTVSAQGINNVGVIVGTGFTSDPTLGQGFILIGSHYTFFSRPGWDNTSARAIANSGLITGFSSSADLSATAGFIYDPRTKTFTDATPPGSGTGFSATQGMNSSGRITGDGRQPDGSGRYGFVWQQRTLGNDGQQLAPFLAQFRIAGVGTAARGINDAGVITGFVNAGSGVVGGFVGNDVRGFQLLVPPGGDAPEAFVGCSGINNANKVVCEVTDALGNNRAFVGTPDQ